MQRTWNPIVTRRAAFGAAGVLALLFAVPAVASAFSTDSSAPSAGVSSAVATLTVVQSGMTPGPGQIAQQTAGGTYFIYCPGTAHVVGGGYQIADGGKGDMLTSAPSLDSSRWYFRSRSVVPVGSQFYAVCAK